MENVSVKVFALILLAISGFFFFESWIDCFGYKYNSVKIVGEVTGDFRTSHNYYHTYIDVVYQGEVYSCVHSSNIEYQNGQKLLVYFNPKRTDEVALVRQNLLMIPIISSLAFIMVLIFSIVAFVKPHLFRFEWGRGDGGSM